MKRILIALLALACGGAVWANGASIGPPGLSGIGPPAQVVTVAKSGGQFPTICGATCGTATAVCAAGSALASFSDSSITKPYIVKIGPGIYDECVAIDNRTDIALIGSGVYATIIRPTVTAASDVLGGVIRLANATGTTASTARIEIADLTVWDDAYTTPSNPAIYVGARDPNSASAAAWQDVDIHDVRAIGNNEAIRIVGTRLTTDTNGPRASVRNSTLIAGAAGLTLGNGVTFIGQDLDILARTNWCETATTTFLSSQTGVVVSGTGNTFVIDAADDFGANDGYVGRKVVLTDTDGGGAGVCGALNQLDTDEFWITDYVTSTDTITAAPTFDEAATSGCTYTIAAVANFSNAPCTDKDWTVIRGGDPNGAYGGPVGIVNKTNNISFSAVPDDFYLAFKNVRIKVEANDFGPGQASPCGAATAPASGGYMHCGTTSVQNVTLDDVDVTYDINVDLDDSATSSPDASCFAAGVVGGAEIEGLAVIKNARCTINNTGDADAAVSAFVANGTNAGTVRVLDGFVDINNTGGGVGATKTDLLQATSGVLVIGNIVSDAAVATSGTITFLNGGTYDAITATAALNFSDPAVAACSTDLTITATGAADGDVVTLGVPNGSIVTGSIYGAWVSATDTVTVRHCCGVADCADPASGTFRVTVRKP